MNFLTEGEVARLIDTDGTIEQGELTWIRTNEGRYVLIRPIFGDYPHEEIVEEGSYLANNKMIELRGLAVSLPSEIIERDLAFQEDRLWIKDGRLIYGDDIDTYDTPQTNTRIQGAKKVVVWINQPDIERNLLNIPVTEQEFEQKMPKLTTRQVKGSYLWYYDKNENYICDQDERETIKPYDYSYRERIPEVEYLLLNKWRPLVETGIVVNGKFRTINFNSHAKAQLTEFYQNYLQLVRPDFSTVWFSPSALGDVNKRAELANMIYRGAILMRLNSNGSAVAYYYPDRDLSYSYIINCHE